jgi:hypothetical protein
VVLHPARADAIVSALEQIPARANVPPENLQFAEAQMVEAARAHRLHPRTVTDPPGSGAKSGNPRD